MGKQVLLRLLILCVALCQGFASLSNNGSLDLLDHLVRRKRIIDLIPHANSYRTHRLQDFNYVVNVQKNGIHVCGGSILSALVIITVATCVEDYATYTILSGTLSTTGGSIHDVNGILPHPEFDPFDHAYNIALLEIQQPIILGRNLHQPITIYNSNNGILPPRSLVTVSGWGLAVQRRGGIARCINPFSERRFVQPNKLQSITVNTINLNVCSTLHHANGPAITNDLICTFHTHKYCAPGDKGNPLVFENQLVGLLVMDGLLRGPDVFVNVATPARRSWIYRNMPNIPTYVPPPNRSGGPPTRPHNRGQP